MAEDRVGTVRRIYERWGRGDFTAGAELYDPHVLLVLRPEFPDPGAYLGPDEIRRYMRDYFLADLHDAAISGGEFVGAGDSVVVKVHQDATGPESGARTRLTYFQVWTFRGDSVVRIESIREREDALAAVAAADRVEIVRAIFERWGRGELAAGTDRYDPHIVFVLRPDFLDSGVYLGPDEIRRYMRDYFLSDLKDAAIVGRELIAAGDSVIVQVDGEVTGPGSGVQVVLHYFQVWTFRGETVVRLESIKEREDALAAVGLDPG